MSKKGFSLGNLFEDIEEKQPKESYNPFPEEFDEEPFVEFVCTCSICPNYDRKVVPNTVTAEGDVLSNWETTHKKERPNCQGRLRVEKI